MKKAILLINAISQDPSPDELDVLIQAEAVETAMEQLAYRTERVFLGLDMQSVTGQLKREAPDLVFNLVESIDNSGKLLYLAPALLEHLHLPFTGSGSEAMFITTNKMLAKTHMFQHGLPTPEWIEGIPPEKRGSIKNYLAKPVWEEASVGITDENFVEGNPASVRAFLSKHGDKPYFFEEFIEGREFNISILAGNTGPEVLPLAEIVFDQYPEGKPKIVGYEAKWDENSFEYKHTTRRFGVENSDSKLAERLKQICLDCWRIFKLRGYVRIDFRVDRAGQPWILEINANPCLSPDAGFFAAGRQAGYSFTEIVERICEDV